MNEYSENSIIEFADVIIPAKVPLNYTYQIPERLKGKLTRGARVIVQFGRKKIITAIVDTIHTNCPTLYQAKFILELLDESPLINQYQFQLTKFVASYYMCNLGEVINVALPSGFKLNSESKIQLNPSHDISNLNNTYQFSETEQKIISYLAKASTATYDELSREFEIPNLNTIIKPLISQGFLIIYEEVKEKYTPKYQKRIKLCKPYESTEAVMGLIDKLEKKIVQVELIQQYLVLSNCIKDFKFNESGVEVSILTEKLKSASPIQTLIKNGIFEEFVVIIPRFEVQTESAELPVLSQEQGDCVQTIESNFVSNKTVLLHGITGSGKTEIYVHLIQKALEAQSQVLLLMPEIALTTQLVNRLQRYFGKQLGVYHSKFSDNERVEVWSGILSGRLKIIIGVRSSVFLPFDNLGLVIIDEEHDSSYKQVEPTPRYNGKDTALMLAKIHHAKVLLGSATPSLESYYLAQSPSWALVNLHTRFGTAVMPIMNTIDMSREQKFKRVRLGISHSLISSLEQNINAHKQSIVFHNRRGYSPLLVCEDCGFTSSCTHCNVSLTYHQFKSSLVCHYCGFKEKVPNTCPACGSAKLKAQGTGTEKIEENVNLLFPSARVERMDADTTKTKMAFQNLINKMETGEIDILVGTQMLSKGFDFANVNMVIVPDFDRILQFPDFRSTERAFQLVSQVAGRAGRRGEKSQLFIQTYKPKHWLLAYLANNNYSGFYNQEIQERQKFGYPPFTRLIAITIKNIKQERAEASAEALKQLLHHKLANNAAILGPEPPPINRIKNYYLQKILIKIQRNHPNLIHIKSLIAEAVNAILFDKQHKSSIVVLDIDPL